MLPNLTQHGIQWGSKTLSSLTEGEDGALRQDIPERFDPPRYHTARWVEADDDKLMKRARSKLAGDMASDHNGAPVFLAKSAWHVTCTEEDWPQVRFLKTREQVH